MNRKSSLAPELSIIVPCYNEAKNIPHILRRFMPVLKSVRVELILVNNGSADDTAAVLKRELSKRQYGFARTVLVPVNIGYGHGILTGLRAAKGKVLAYTHADLQTPPEDVFKAYHMYQDRQMTKHLVKGARKGRKPIDAVFTWCYGALASVVFLSWLHEINAQPKVFPRELLALLDDAPKDFSLDLYLLAKAKRAHYAITEFPVDFGARLHGASKWAFSPKAKLKGVARFFGGIFRARWMC
ncbi:hypothetical protein AUJ68_06350 [Candidatus Woesearchaeota archaeon CG1_02_57_44]|nr:MAG: hypothetical protein AUJ68_06350 [Candidatus Woesearchaeota archaeon CG1_02_57_44]